MSTFENIIKDYIEKSCKGDEVLAKKYEDSGKDIEGCCKYIKSEAKKKAKNGCAVISDAEVFGWAIHYFDEGLKAPKDAPEAKVTTSPTAEVVKSEAPKPAPKPVAKAKPKKDEGLMSLFDFDEEEE